MIVARKGISMHTCIGCMIDIWYW